MAAMRLAASFALLVTTAAAAAAEPPSEIAAKGETVIFQAHAEGAQIYDCKADAAGNLAWQFREPIATLIRDGETVGRHYAGPTWEIAGSAIVGKLVARAPGAAAKDIPWLKLDVSDRNGDGPLREVTTVQRINTRGGNTEGVCEKAGDFRSEPYAADYVFLKK